MSKFCAVCGCEIPAERVEALPETTTCVKHSTVTSVVGFMVPTASKGCAPELHIVNTSNQEAMRQATNANRRKR